MLRCDAVLYLRCHSDAAHALLCCMRCGIMMLLMGCCMCRAATHGVNSGVRCTTLGVCAYLCTGSQTESMRIQTKRGGTKPQFAPGFTSETRPFMLLEAFDRFMSIFKPYKPFGAFALHKIVCPIIRLTRFYSILSEISFKVALSALIPTKM